MDHLRQDIEHYDAKNFSRIWEDFNFLFDTRLNCFELEQKLSKTKENNNAYYLGTGTLSWTDFADLIELSRIKPCRNIYGLYNSTCDRSITCHCFSIIGDLSWFNAFNLLNIVCKNCLTFSSTHCNNESTGTFSIGSQQ